MCGAVAGEPHPYDPTRKTRLHIGHIVDKSMGGTDNLLNLRALCSVCNEGAANLTLDRPSCEKLLIQIRRSTGADHNRSGPVKNFIVANKKFPKQAEKLLKES
jgi:5-methylcytosine-specific restriction endonuclease McrA